MKWADVSFKPLLFVFVIAFIFILAFFWFGYGYTPQEATVIRVYPTLKVEVRFPDGTTKDAEAKQIFEVGDKVYVLQDGAGEWTTQGIKP